MTRIDSLLESVKGLRNTEGYEPGTEMPFTKDIVTKLLETFDMVLGPDSHLSDYCYANDPAECENCSRLQSCLAWNFLTAAHQPFSGQLLSRYEHTKTRNDASQDTVVLHDVDTIYQLCVIVQNELSFLSLHRTCPMKHEAWFMQEA